MRAQLLFRGLFGACCLAAAPAMSAQATGTHTLPNHTAPLVTIAPDLGPMDPSGPLTIRVWLNLHNAAALSQLADDVNDDTSPSFQQWMSDRQFADNYAPTAAEAATVRSFLAANGLSVTATDPNNLFVTARGTVGEVQNAFHVQLHNFEVGGRIVHANTSDPSVTGAAGALIAAVGGLTSSRVTNHSVHPADPDSGKPFAAVPLSATPNGAFFSSQCFRPPESHTFTTDGSLPTATYFGNRYGADLANAAPPNLPPCGYAPNEVQTAYGMNNLYAHRLDGTGQTIVIVDAFGSPSIQDDEATFTAFYGQPAANLTIYQPSGPPVTGSWNADQQGWAGETTLDVEYAHTMAPGANLALVEALSDSDDDLGAALAFVVENHPGNVVSNSWGEPESSVVPATLALYNLILQSAAARGISVHFSSGDSGDFVNPVSGCCAEGYADVSFPADLPYVTAVGGTSLAVNADDSMKFQTGWGNDYTRIATEPDANGYNVPIIPPLQIGFLYGSGGGSSRIYAKPHFQRGLSGKYRRLPDIAYLADPYTGVEYIETQFDSNGNPEPGNQGVGVIGGTSLACPMFSGMWAIADQAARHNLGQAAASVYNLPPGAVDDIVPVGSLYDVFGILTTSSGVTFETPLDLSFPETTAPFLNALYDNPLSFRWYVLSFGTDSSLQTARGWDDVTGVGAPNGKAFVDAVAH